nr:hypothetical protein [Tanacetum cinerariifolium]
IIMAQSQGSADVHQYELCPPNKRYALMDANKKDDLENPLCPDESRILADDLILQDTLQVSLVEQKSHEELKATQNVEKVKEHLIAEEIEKLEPRSDKESPKVENIADISQPVIVIKKEEESAEDAYELRRKEKGKHVGEIKNTPSPTIIRSPRIPTTLVSSYTEKLQELTKIDILPLSSTPSSSSPKSKLSTTNQLLSLFKAKPSRYKSFFQELQGRYGFLFEHLLAKFMPRRKFNVLAKFFEDIMMESLPNLVDERIKKILQTQVPLHVAQGLILETEKSQADVAKMIAKAIQQERTNLYSEISSKVNVAIANHIPSQVDSSVMSYMSPYILHVHSVKDTIPLAQEQQYQLYLTIKDDPQLQKDDISIWLALKIKFKRLQVATTPCRPSVVCPREQDDPHDDAHPEGRIVEPGPSTLGNHEQSDDFDYWTNSYAIDDDVFPNEKASQELMDEIAQTVDEAKLHKVVDEMLRQQCASGDEH